MPDICTWFKFVLKLRILCSLKAANHLIFHHRFHRSVASLFLKKNNVRQCLLFNESKTSKCTENIHRRNIYLFPRTNVFLMEIRTLKLTLNLLWRTFSGFEVDRSISCLTLYTSCSQVRNPNASTILFHFLEINQENPDFPKGQI